MTDEQVQALLIELVHITRGFADAVRQISDLKAEIVALQWILESKGLADPGEIEAAKAELLRKYQPAPLSETPAGLENPRVAGDGLLKWKM